MGEIVHVLHEPRARKGLSQQISCQNVSVFEWVQIDRILGIPITPDRNCCIGVGIDGMTGNTSVRASPAATSAATVEFVVNELILCFRILE